MSEKYISVFAAVQAKPEFLNENHENKDSALYAKGWNACNKEYIDNLLDIPAEAVRPVVCCKDCIHWKHNPGTNRMYCSVWDWINSSTGEDYCSFAERRLEKMEGIEQIDLFPELSRFQKWKNKLTAKIIKILKRRR